MSVTYSSNWMGPVSEDWQRKGDYSGGRIDIRDSDKLGYDGWDEYGLPFMSTESWNILSDWLMELETDTKLSYNELMERFESDTGHKIRWWVDDE